MLIIRDFRPEDLSSVSAIIEDVFNRFYNANFYVSIYESWRSGFLVAESESGIVGVLAAMLSVPKEARILLMAVRPEYRDTDTSTGNHNLRAVENFPCLVNHFHLFQVISVRPEC